MQPKVSVNLCCYNGEQFLEEALQSVFLQTYKDWELVVINDGSTDSTERIIMKHMAVGMPIVYHSQKNAGLGSARGKAFQLSRGDYLAFIDQDDVWLPHKLERQISVAEADQSVGLVFSDSYYIDESGRGIGTAFKRAPPPPGDPLIGLLTQRNFIPCLTVLVRKEAVKEVGGFNSTLKFIEDLDLFLKIAQKYKVFCIHESLTKYRIHAGNIGGTGSVGMTKETLQVLREFFERFDLSSKAGHWRIRKRLAFLWCKLIGQYLRQGDLGGLFYLVLGRKA